MRPVALKITVAEVEARRVPRFGDVAAQLVANGYKPVPLHFGKKNPTPRDWRNYVFDAKHITGTFAPHRSAGTGIITGRIVAVDIDVRDKNISEEIEALAVSMLGPAPRRVGDAPKLLLVYRTEKPFSIINGVEHSLPGDAEGAKKHHVEVLANGQQFVCFNLHPATGRRYSWNGGGNPLTVPAADLVCVTQAQMIEFVGRADRILSGHALPPGACGEADSARAAPTAPGTAAPALPDDLEQSLRADAAEQAQNFGSEKALKARDPDECRAALRAIPNADAPYDYYIKLGYAIAGALGADGRNDFHEWAAKSKNKYDEKTTEAAWRGFMKKAPHSRGAGSIFYDAKLAGWKPEKPAVEGDAVAIERLSDEWLTEVPPQQQWLWDQTVPLGSVTVANAEGGAGKSWFALRLTEACAHGSERFMSFTHDARALRQGSAVYVNAEDPAVVIRRRLWAIQQRKIANQAHFNKGAKLAKWIAEYRARLKKHVRLLHLAGKQFSLVTMTNGQMVYGPGLDRLMEELRKVADLTLVVLDPLARLHACEENSNTVGTMLINAGERIAHEFNCAVLILHHVSKEAASKGTISAHSGRGGSSVGDGARSVLRLVPAREADLKGIKLLRPDLVAGKEVQIDPSEVAAETVIVMHHAKSSYGPKQRPRYLLRDSTGELLPLKVVIDTSDPHAVQMDRLGDWLAKNPQAVTKNTFREDHALREEVFGKLSRQAWTTLFEDAVARGELVEDPAYKAENPRAKGFVRAK